MMNSYKIGDVVELKKVHPSGTKNWIITFIGIDIKLKSTVSNTLFIVIPRTEFPNKVKGVVSKNEIQTN